ncbi:MAG TPA: hypothetical protein VFA04_12795 [Bryobacteraceae bacterium]|nr:hypothetical protein [Bryobacteraceae bacterium]
MAFDPSRYGETIENILALDGGGNRLLPLVCEGCSSQAARAALKRANARDLFPAGAAPEAAMSGLWLYFSCFDECHGICQDLPSAEGSYWHAILHRQEPDAWNSGYWFRRVGDHAIFPALLEAAREIATARPDAGLRIGSRWDPIQFIEFCDKARQQPGSPAFDAAREVQRAEWQLLFDHCARPQS